MIAYDPAGAKVYDSLLQGVNAALMPETGYVRFAGPAGARFKISAGSAVPAGTWADGARPQRAYSKLTQSSSTWPSPVSTTTML